VSVDILADAVEYFASLCYTVLRKQRDILFFASRREGSGDAVFSVEIYIDKLIELLKQRFGSRLLYVGLQGSYLRNEADEKSDIDVMAVVDSLSVDDLKSYREIINSFENSDKACGFICGKTELMNWNALEVCQIVHTTKDYYGKLIEFLPAYTAEDELNYIKLSLNNLYHELCHRYIYAPKTNTIAKLPDTYKSVFFILQNIYFHRTGDFVQTKQGLLSKLSGQDQKVLTMALELRNQNPYDFDEAFELIFQWCGQMISNI